MQGIIYVFDDFELDAQRYELRQGGALCAIDPQSFNVLLYLIQHRDRVVSKDELLEQLWPHQSVSESTLTQRLRTARQALGDSGREQHTIKTTHGRGYRFVAAVAERSRDEAASEPDGEAVTRVCPACQQVNTGEARFCHTCGASLRRSCPACAQENAPEAQFCDACGLPLETARPAPVETPRDIRDTQRVEETDPPSGDRPPAAGERRQLTVVFCDLVDSTALALHHDPEDLHDMLRTYHQHGASVMQRYEGHIAQYLGDGLLVYFGYPQAHEDDAGRAIRASLDLLDTLAVVNTELSQTYGAEVAIRIGIHTGLVVVGEMGNGERPEHLALGETPTMAFRLQELAAPNSVVISESTSHLAEGLFVCEPLGPQLLKGYPQPQVVYQVLQASPTRSRLDVAALRGLTPLAGRTQEVGLLLERWEQAREGRGQVVVLSGEAGIGKSRLVRVLQDHVVGDAHTWLQGRCSPYHQRTALYAVVELIQGILQWQETDTPAVKRMKLEQAVRQAHLPVEETVRRVADLLSLPLPGPTVAPRPLDPEPERQQLFAALLALLHAATAEHPVILIVEDLHWADPSTLDLLAVLIAQTPTVPMLLMLTCRPEFQSPWAMRSYMAQVTLTRLSREQMAAMVAHLMGSKELPDALLQHLISQTDGVPLFIEELTKAVLESGVLMETEDGYALTQPVSALAIPTTLHDALMARLDRLGTAKEVAQLGAVIGRQFSYALLQAVSQREHTTLQQALAELVEAELLYQRGLPPQATYQFKHALIQDAAYQSLLRRTRRNLHQRLVQVVAERFPDLGETQPEWLAHHYEEAGLPEQAVPAWHRAGDQAARRAANPEAIGHFTKALDLLRTLPESPERRRHALILHIALGERLELTRGTAAPEVEQAYTRAYELCQQMEDTPLLDRVLTGLFSVYFMRTALPHARELAEELLSHAQRQNDPSLLVNAYSFLGLPLFDAGEIAPARAYFGQAIALYDLQFHPQQQLYDLVFHDVGVRCHTNEALALWYLGYADQALARNQEGFALAEERSRPFRLSTVLNGLARIHQCRREVEAVRERAETAITLSREHGFPDHLAISTHLRGWALAMQGQAEEGIAQMRQGLAAYETTGVERLRPDFLINLAEVYGHVEQYETALTMLAEALAHVEATGQRVYEAEIVRLQGELLLAQSPDHQPQAETCFHRALDIARHQQAKALELRAATSLARLWQSQDKPQAAYDLLAPIYGWFTEGFDTADLQEAKALLAELT